MTNIVYTEPKGTAFARFARALAVCKGDLVGAEAFAEANGWPTVAAAFKGLISAQDSASFSAATSAITSGFIAQVRAQEIILGKLATRPAILNTRQVVGIGSAVAGFVAEGQPKPLSAGAFTAVALEPRKVIGHCVITSEVVRASHQHADDIVLGEMVQALAEAKNVAFVDPSLAGSVTFGAPTVTSTGSTVTAIDADLRAVLQVAFDAGLSLQAGAWIVNPQTAAFLSLLRASGSLAYPSITITGGTLLGLKVIVSSAVGEIGSPTTRFIALVDAQQVLLANDGETSVSLAQQASVMMSDTPSVGATSLVSLWQNNLLGLRVEQFVAWKVVRSGAVVLLDDIAY